MEKRNRVSVSSSELEQGTRRGRWRISAIVHQLHDTYDYAGHMCRQPNWETGRKTQLPCLKGVGQDQHSN